MADVGRRNFFDPIGNYNFVVDGISNARFSNVDGLSAEVEMIEYRTSEDPNQVRYRPGLSKGNRIILKRGFVLHTDMNKWVEDIAAGTYERKDATIELHDNTGETIASWNLFRCIPTKWSLGALEGKGNAVVLETIEFVVEEIIRADSGGGEPAGASGPGFWESIGGAIGGSAGATVGAAVDSVGGIDGDSHTPH